MIAVDIGAHPDAPDYYIQMGKPADWSEEDCGTLAVRRVGVTGDILFEPPVRIVRSDLPSGESIYPAFMSEWVPTPDELDRLNMGEPVRLLVSGNNLPPMAVWVRGDTEV